MAQTKNNIRLIEKSAQKSSIMLAHIDIQMIFESDNLVYLNSYIEIQMNKINCRCYELTTIDSRRFNIIKYKYKIMFCIPESRSGHGMQIESFMNDISLKIIKAYNEAKPLIGSPTNPSSPTASQNTIDGPSRRRLG